MVSAPKDCVQGDEFPFYAKWDQSRTASFTLRLPEGIDIKELYNVKAEGVRIESLSPGLMIRITGLEVNGYVGGLCSTEVLEEPQVIRDLEFEILSEGQIVRETKRIELFRADIKIAEVPKEIRIQVDRDGRFKVARGVSLKNKGKGTGLVMLMLHEDSEVKEGELQRLQEFYAAFGRDLKKNIDSLLKAFPEHQKAIELWASYLDRWSTSGLEGLEEATDLQEELQKAQEADEKFREACAKAVIDAYLNNIRVFTDVDSFLSYLKSIQNRGIIFLNPLMTLKVNESPSKFRAYLNIVDLAGNQYEPIELGEILLSATKESIVPIYQLISAGTNERFKQ